MGKTILAIGLVILVVGTVGASQMLAPTDIGTPNSTGWSGGGDPFLYAGFSVGNTPTEVSGATCGACHAVVEFDISGVNLTEAQFCQAFLNGIRVQQVDYDEDPPGDGSFTVQVYNLADLYEDGTVTSSDFNSTSGSPITALNITPGSVGTVFNNIDVTEAVRHDLFDPGQTNYSGFILVSADALNESVDFYEDEPRLEIIRCPEIPTLSKSGVILLILILAGTAYMIMRRRKKRA